MGEVDGLAVDSGFDSAGGVGDDSRLKGDGAGVAAVEGESFAHAVLLEAFESRLVELVVDRGLVLAVEEDAPAAVVEAAAEHLVEGVEVGDGEDVLGFVDDEGVEGGVVGIAGDEGGVLGELLLEGAFFFAV